MTSKRHSNGRSVLPKTDERMELSPESRPALEQAGIARPMALPGCAEEAKAEVTSVVMIGEPGDGLDGFRALVFAIPASLLLWYLALKIFNNEYVIFGLYNSSIN